MTINCDLCDRGTARKALTPTWWPYEVCDRKRCRTAARDATNAIIHSRERYDSLIGAIAQRHESQWHAWGYRADAMAEIDVVEGRDWWANNIAKKV